VRALPQLCELVADDGDDFWRSNAGELVGEAAGQIGDRKETDQCQYEEQRGNRVRKKYYASSAAKPAPLSFCVPRAPCASAVRSR
jgi:hypothetical protein